MVGDVFLNSNFYVYFFIFLNGEVCAGVYNKHILFTFTSNQQTHWYFPRFLGSTGITPIHTSYPTVTIAHVQLNN